MTLTRKIAGISAAVAVVLGSGAVALAASNGASQTAAATATTDVHGCIATSQNRTLVNVYKDAGVGLKCPKGSFGPVDLQGEPGAQGKTGPAGPKGATGPAGPQGPAGPGGDSGVLTVTGTTNVTGWAESSGWATDAFTRVLSLTRQHAADSAKCGGTPTCWFYTGTLTDNGSFQTVSGAPSPNGSSAAKVAGILDGTMQGTAAFQFYASSGAPDGSLVPVSADGSAKPASTTGWGELALPAGTTFAGVQLTAYSWTYTAPSTCEKWLDQINPGDDGQGAGDGNITGVNACTA
jgi:hypothetical protein